MNKIIILGNIKNRWQNPCKNPPETIHFFRGGVESIFRIGALMYSRVHEWRRNIITSQNCEKSVLENNSMIRG